LIKIFKKTRKTQKLHVFSGEMYRYFMICAGRAGDHFCLGLMQLDQIFMKKCMKTILLSLFAVTVTYKVTFPPNLYVVWLSNFE